MGTDGLWYTASTELPSKIFPSKGPLLVTVLCKQHHLTKEIPIDLLRSNKALGI